MDLGGVPAQMLMAPAATKWPGRQQWKCVQCLHSALGLPRVGRGGKAGTGPLESTGSQTYTGCEKPLVCRTAMKIVEMQWLPMHDEVIDVFLTRFDLGHHLTSKQLYQLRPQQQFVKINQWCRNSQNILVNHFLHNRSLMNILGETRNLVTTFWRDLGNLLLAIRDAHFLHIYWGFSPSKQH